MDSRPSLSLRVLDHNVHCSLKERSIALRPSAGAGIWLSVLLPIAVIAGAWKYPNSSALYQDAAAISLSLIITTSLFIIKAQYQNKPKTIFPTIYFAPGAVIAMVTLLFICKNCFLLSLCGGVFSAYSYVYGIVWLLRACRQCFTFGEASVIVQAIILFLYATLTNLYSWLYLGKDSAKCMDTSTIILQVGWFGIGTICCSVYFFRRLRATSSFYGVSAVILLVVVVPLLHIALKASPILWILQLLVADLSTVVQVAYWAICSVIAIVAVSKQIHGQQKASTMVRKYFHALAVAVFIPGLIQDRCLLYLASGIVMALFVVLEMLRVLCMPPLGDMLQEGFSIFADDKDQGGLSLTPVYLLGGCSLPLWLHPAPSHTSLLPLLSGLLTIGIGDTAASICGTLFGKHRWSGGPKTLEGTLGCFLSQLSVVSMLVFAGYLEHSTSVWLRSIFGIAVTSLIEAKTDQIDNLALPIVMYILLL